MYRSRSKPNLIKKLRESLARNEERLFNADDDVIQEALQVVISALRDAIRLLENAKARLAEDSHAPVVSADKTAVESNVQA